MSKKVPIETFFIGRTMVDREEVERWLTFLGCQTFQCPEEDEEGGPITNPALLIALAAKRCYKSFEVNAELNANVTRIRAEWGEYLTNILEQKHGAVLEHSVYTVAIENVSRVFTAEMNRHRAGWAISEGSLRFIRFQDAVPYWEPTSILGPDVLTMNEAQYLRHAHVTFVQRELEQHPVRGLEAKQHASRILVERAFQDDSDLYKCLTIIWQEELAPESTFSLKKHITSMMRRVIGLGVATGGVWTGNIRALRHVMTMRCSPAAEEEILHVWSRVCVCLKKREPMLFGDFHQDAKGFWRPRYEKV